jgi:hypothetical protein
MPLELWATLGLLPLAFLIGRIHKRRINGGKGYTMKQQMKHHAFAAVIFWGLMLIAALARGDTPQKLPPLGSATRSGRWALSGKEIALPLGPLCQTHARILTRHVTLKVVGARMFEATLAVVRPQHKQGNILSIFVDNEEADAIHLQYGQEPYPLRVPLPPGAQTLTLMEQRNFPSVLICNPRLS